VEQRALSAAHVHNSFKTREIMFIGGN